MPNLDQLFLERETRFELATSTLARLHSTTELFPLFSQYQNRTTCNKEHAKSQYKNSTSSDLCNILGCLAQLGF